MLMGFALAGKKTDNTTVLTPGYRGKTKPNGRPCSGRHGPSIGFMGHLHSFLRGESIQQTLWINLFSGAQIEEMRFYTEGVGQPPWEQMPEGEDCQAARRLRGSLMGWLVPLSRFCLLEQDGLHYTEGIAYPTYKDGGVDPSVAVNRSAKTPKTLWVDPEKRPWRQLTALLGFMGQSAKGSFECPQISLGLGRARGRVTVIGIWSGGLRVSSNAGEQYASGSDDFVESMVLLETEVLGESWYHILSQEMNDLEGIAKRLYGAILNFYQQQKMDGGDYAAMGSNLFWQLAERYFQQLLQSCEPDGESVRKRQELRRRFASLLLETFDNFCPHETARQLEAWATSRPNLSDY